MREPPGKLGQTEGSMSSLIDSRHARQTAYVAAGFILAVSAFRLLRAALLPDLPNFAPVMAMAFCGGLFLPGLSAWVLPLAAICLSDLVLNVVLKCPLIEGGQLAAWACLVFAVAAGRWLASRRPGPSLTAIAGVLTANAMLFYLVTNTISWLVMPEYARTLAGWWQAVTVGIPGYPPTWTFFRNALLGDFVFTGLILAVREAAIRSGARQDAGEAVR